MAFPLLQRLPRPHRVPARPSTVTALLCAALLAGLPLASRAAGPRVALERVLPAEKLERPVYLTAMPGTGGTLVVVEQRGVVRHFKPGAKRAGGVLLDIHPHVSTAGNEEGLLSIAFHPKFAENRAFFVYYTAAHPRRSVVARFVTNASLRTALPKSEQIVLEVPQPYANHNGGQLAFGPDGMLYVGLGDGGAAGDPYGNAQNRKTLLGSILRIDVDKGDMGRPYAAPADNPFVSAKDGTRPEIWAYGLRNPWRFSFDRRTGALYAADVGQDMVEEVDRIVAGANYGWNLMEGSECYQPKFDCNRKGLTLPISEYTHAMGRSITGGFVYRGAALPALYGRYVFADYVSGQVWSIPAEAKGHSKPELLLTTRLNISSFGEDADGELYVLDHQGGQIFRLVPAP